MSTCTQSVIKFLRNILQHHSVNGSECCANMLFKIWQCRKQYQNLKNLFLFFSLFKIHVSRICAIVSKLSFKKNLVHPLYLPCVLGSMIKTYFSYEIHYRVKKIQSHGGIFDNKRKCTCIILSIPVWHLSTTNAYGSWKCTYKIIDHEQYCKLNYFPVNELFF